MEDIKTIIVEDNESIKSVALETLIKGEDGESHMTYIDLSTDMEHPTEITNYLKSGTYVARNKGILGISKEPFTLLSEGMFFKVYNLKEIYELVGMEISDEENMITITIPSIEGYYDHILMKQGMNDWVTDGVTLNSLNVNDYVNVDIDTSRLIDKYNNINSTYGVQTVGNYLAISSASQSDINSGTNVYKPIACNMIDYAVKNKGEKYFPKITDFNTLNSDITTLKNEIEQVLDTVVSV